MSKLQIQYSKELARELGKIAVYLPGEHINVGDIIKFPFGNSLLGKPRPLGSFEKVTSLKNLGVSYKEPEYSSKPDTYRFTSKNSVQVNLEIGGNANIGKDNLPSGSGDLKIGFSSEGAIYFLAVDCDSLQLDDLNSLENEINAKGKKMLWDDTFLVTSVTVAKKALIVQSQSKNSEIQISGNVKGIEAPQVKIGANTQLSIKKQKGDLFMKDWSDNVTVFMNVVLFEQEVFDENFKGIETPTSNEREIKLKLISIDELLTD